MSIKKRSQLDIMKNNTHSSNKRASVRFGISLALVLICGVSFGNTIESLSLVASSPNNDEWDDLICEYSLAGTATSAATAWYRNGQPLMALYMPFEGSEANAPLDFSGSMVVDGLPGVGVLWSASGGHDGNGAYEFDGSSGAEIDMGVSLPSGGYTKVAWVKRTGDGKNNILSGDSAHAFWAPDHYSHRLSSGHDGSWSTVQDGVALGLDTWHLVAVTYDPNINDGEMVLYKDGLEVDQAINVAPPSSLGQRVWVGAYAGAYNWEGAIDEVRLYGFALTAEQIAALYYHGQDRIAYPETSAGDVWQTHVTPFSSSERGATVVSNTLTIQSAPPVLNWLEIQGPIIVVENDGADYDAVAHYTDGSSVVVEPDSWAVDCPSIADISAMGLLTSYEVLTNESCTVSASFTEGAVTMADIMNISIYDSSSYPQIENLLLSASSPNNDEWDDLICDFNLAGTATTSATAWYRNGIPQMALYLPIEGGEANAPLDYSGSMAVDGLPGAGVLWSASGGHDGNGAYEFDASTGADIEVGVSLSSDGYTKVAWVKRTGSGKNNILSGDSAHAFWAPDIYSFRLSAGHDGRWNAVQDNVALGLGSWHLVAVTYDPNRNGGEMVLYKDGLEVDRAINVAPPSSLGQRVWVGAYAGQNNWGGAIDEVRLYDFALSAEQITSLNDNGQNHVSFPETSAGDVWQSHVTPFSSSERGAAFVSNTLTIQMAPPLLYVLEIQGPAIVVENTGAEYDAVAHYTDGSSVSVEPESWDVDCPSIADISATGFLMSYEVLVNEPCTVSASYTDGVRTVAGFMNISIYDSSSFPQIENLSLSASSPNNDEWDDLICDYALAGTATTSATAWYRNGQPLMALYMPFEGGDANAPLDYSGSLVVDGLPGAGVLWSTNGGRYGNGAYEFDGSSSAEIEVGVGLPSSEYTKIAWVKRTGSGKNNILSGDSAHAFWAPDIYSYRLSAGHDGNWNAVQDGVALGLDTWHLVAVTYDPNRNGGEMVLYKDGLEVDRAINLAPPSSLGQRVWVGAYAGQNNWGGAIDEVRLYDSALTAAQIAALHNNGQNHIAFQETSAGDVWQTHVTPFSSNQRGTTVVSNTLTLQGTAVPSVVLDRLEIQGPINVVENTGVDYNAIAHYTDGSSMLVEPDSWAVDCPLIAYISVTGLLTSFEVLASESCTVSASYAEGGYSAIDMHLVTILDSNVLSIMPLGDSITYGVGSTDIAGYRSHLYGSLIDQGYDVNFVGSLQNGPNDIDVDHEGHKGWYADNIRDNVYDWLVTQPADVVLLHIGTNDISTGQPAAQIAVEIDEILDRIEQYEMDYGRAITVVVALIINRSDPGSVLGLSTSELNLEISAMMDSRVQNGDSVFVVDQESALIYPDDLADTNHPNDSGYLKMGDVWLNAILELYP